MNDYKVKPYSEAHLDGIRGLWEEQYGVDQAKRREVLFKWFTEKNPFMKDESPYFVVLENNTVIGLWGHMPVKYSVKGKRYDGYMSQDALLAKKTRGKGIGKKVLMEINAQRKGFAGALWFNEPNFRLYSKYNWLPIPDLKPQVRVINPKKFSDYKFKNKIVSTFVAALLSAVIILKTKEPKTDSRKIYRISEINHFTEEFDQFFSNVSKHYGIMTIRSSSYLNWKFVKKPFNKYKRFAAFNRTGVLLGYMVLKIDNVNKPYKGKILDLLIDPKNLHIYDLLLKHALKIFKQNGVWYSEILNTCQLFKSVLKNNGYLYAAKPQRFMTINWQNSFSQSYVGNIKNWYLTFSDADGDSWN